VWFGIKFFLVWFGVGEIKVFSWTLGFCSNKLSHWLYYEWLWDHKKCL